MKDIVVVALLVVAFALAITLHVVLSVALLGRVPRWRGLLAFIAPPLAPYWAWREGMRKRALFWIGSVVLYAVMLVLASRRG